MKTAKKISLDQKVETILKNRRKNFKPRCKCRRSCITKFDAKCLDEGELRRLILDKTFLSYERKKSRPVLIFRLPPIQFGEICWDKEAIQVCHLFWTACTGLGRTAAKFVLLVRNFILFYPT